MELTKLKCKCGHHYKIHASIEGCLACEGHYCGEGQVSILENAHAALETANADLLEVLGKIVEHIAPEPQGKASGLANKNRRLHWLSELRELRIDAELAIRKHKGK